MANALLTGVSGLRVHQRLLDVVGNNIANLNTTAFKTQRAVFADLLYETTQPASGANEGSRGGVNPSQIGNGVKIAKVERNFNQGSLEVTGHQYDMAIEGNGFFVVNDGVQDFYTRAGTFSLDEQGTLVTPNGLRVKRIPGPGEPDGTSPAFQIPGDASIRVPIGSSVAGVVTTEVNLTGNLNAGDTPPIPEVMESPTPFETAAGTATGATLLNDLTSSDSPYAAGDLLHLSGFDTDGSNLNFSLGVSDTSTLQDVVDAINANVSGFTADLQGGRLVLTANSPGDSNFSIRFRNDPGNTGSVAWTLHEPTTTIEGKLASIASSNVTVYDSRGGAHELSLAFEKQSDDLWRMTASMPSADGTLTKNTIDNIVFDDEGNLLSTGDPTLTLQVAGISNPQTIHFDFVNNETLETMTHFVADSAISASQDGSAAGTIVSASIESSGEIRGIASNGRVFTIAQLALASFRNPTGLLGMGDNLFSHSLNSGEPEVGPAGSDNRGAVRAGQLESSNVDIAFEFTRLIIAQRGFAANARTVTVSDEVLEELTNIIR